MVAKILDGKKIAAELTDSLKIDVEKFLSEHRTRPGLTVVLVGDDPASKVYVGRKHKSCEEIGMVSEVVRLPENTTESELLAEIDRLNSAAAVHGILIQLPLPGHIKSEKVLGRIRPDCLLEKKI